MKSMPRTPRPAVQAADVTSSDSPTFSACACLDRSNETNQAVPALLKRSHGEVDHPDSEVAAGCDHDLQAGDVTPDQPEQTHPETANPNSLQISPRDRKETPGMNETHLKLVIVVLAAIVIILLLILSYKLAASGKSWEAAAAGGGAVGAIKALFVLFGQIGGGQQ